MKEMGEIRSKINTMMCELNEMKDNLLFVMGELNDLKKEQETVDEWIPNAGEKYYYINLDAICTDYVWWNNEQIDNARYNHRVIFKTKKEASEYLEYLLEKEKYMNTFTEEEWRREDITKFCYYCQYSDDDNTHIKVGATVRVRESMKSYFRTEEEVKDFMQKYEWQIKHELN